MQHLISWLFFKFPTEGSSTLKQNCLVWRGLFPLIYKELYAGQVLFNPFHGQEKVFLKTQWFTFQALRKHRWLSVCSDITLRCLYFSFYVTNLLQFVPTFTDPYGSLLLTCKFGPTDVFLALKYPQNKTSCKQVTEFLYSMEQIIQHLSSWLCLGKVFYHWVIYHIC